MIVGMSMPLKRGWRSGVPTEVFQGLECEGFWLPGGHLIVFLLGALVLGRLCGQVGFGHCWFECGKGLLVGMQW